MEQEPDRLVRSMGYTSRATLDYEQHWAPLDLEFVSATKRLRGCLLANKIHVFTDHQGLQQLDRVTEHTPRVQRGMEFPTAYQCSLEYREGSINGTIAPPLPPKVSSDRTLPRPDSIA